MRRSGVARHDRALGRKAELVTGGRLHPLQPCRGSARDPDRERMQRHPLHDRQRGGARLSAPSISVSPTTPTRVRLNDSRALAPVSSALIIAVQAKSLLMGCSKQPRYSITSSARPSNDGGSVSPRAFAVLRLTTSSNFTGSSIGKSAGFSPFKTL